MSYEQFWFDNMDILNFYIKKAEIDIKKEESRINSTAWINGKYILQAIVVAFQDNKKTNIEYPDKPFELNYDNNKKDSEMTDAEIQYYKMKNTMSAWNTRRKMQGKS